MAMAVLVGSTCRACTRLNGGQFKSPRAVAEFVNGGHTCLVQHGEEQIPHRRAARIADMPSALDPGNAASDKQEWQIRIEVQISVAQRAAVKDERGIEQRTVAVRGGTPLLQIIGPPLPLEHAHLHTL